MRVVDTSVAELRARMIVEIGALQSGDDAAMWAHRSLSLKNTLTSDDAQQVEANFVANIAAFSHDKASTELRKCADGEAKPQDSETEPSKPEEEGVSTGNRVMAKTIRLRDKDHRKYVSHEPCVVRGRRPAERIIFVLHSHARWHASSDEFTVPVCRIHHRELHRYGDEAKWWKGVNIDPVPIALMLWQHTRANGANVSMK